LLLQVAILLIAPQAQSHAQTQSELNADVCSALRQAEQKMQETYSRVLERRKDDHAFVTKISRAQAAWKAFLDASLEAVYPAEDKQSEYGTMFPMCSCGKAIVLVEDRTKQLEVWLAGVSEGEVCAGSVPVK
jgi:uncharacterized protein YecT (DUF1311 family)